MNSERSILQKKLSNDYGIFLMLSRVYGLVRPLCKECGNIEPTARHFDLFSSLLSCSPYTVQFQSGH